MSTSSIQANIQLNPVINLTGLSKELAKAQAEFNRGSRGFGSQYTAALGSMTSATRNFDQVLGAANKRVIGFGLSLSVIGGAVKGFRELVSATRELDASMARIGSVMALTGRQSQQVFSGLFDVARKTGESVENAADAFEELSKQGGNAQQVLAKVQVALGLAKVTGIGVTESVNGLTSALSNFRSAGESYASIADKISATTRSFRAGGADILDVISKFGAEAQDAGVSLNKLIGIVAALQTTTNAAGGNIGTSLGRIAARLSDPTNLKSLSGISTLDLKQANGEYKNTIGILDELARKYNQLSQAQQQQVGKVVGSTRDPNTTKALLSDIASASGVAARTSQLLDKSTGDLNTRLFQQTNTLDQSLKNLGTTATQVAAVVGKFTLTPAIKNITSGGGAVADLFKGLNGESVGAQLGQGILKGIGNVLSGPGLIVIGRIIAGVVGRTIPEVSSELKQAGGFGAFGSRAPNEQEVLRGVNVTLAQATEEEKRRYAAADTVAKKELIIKEILTDQLIVTRAIVAENQAVAASLAGEERLAFGRIGGGLRGAAGGYVGAMGLESAAISVGVGGAPSSARPVYVPNVAGGIVANTSEFKVGSGAGTSIYNVDMIQRYGLPRGATPIAAGGHIGNYAAGGSPFQYGDLGVASVEPFNQLLSKLGSASTVDSVTAIATQFKTLTQALDEATRGKALEKLGTNLKAVSAAAEQANAIRARDFPAAPRFSDALLARQTEASYKANLSPAERYKAQQVEQGFRQIEAGSASSPVNPGVVKGEIASGLAALSQLGRTQVGPANVAIAGYGPVLRNGPFATPEQLAVLQRQDQVRSLRYGTPNLALRADEDGSSLPLSERIASGYRSDPYGTIRARSNAYPSPIGPAFVRRGSSAAVEEEGATGTRKDRSGLANGLLFAGIAADLAAGFVPDRAGGNRTSQSFGALSGGLKGFGFASSIGAPLLATPLAPLGAAILAGGTIAGGVLGYRDKSAQSLSDISQSASDSESPKAQALSNANAFVSANAALQEARGTGASPAVISRLTREAASAGAQVPPDLRAKLLGSSTQSDAIDGLIEDLDNSHQRTNALRSIGQFAQGQETDPSVAAQGLASIAGNHADLSPIAGDKDATLAKVRTQLSQSGLSASEATTVFQQLDKLDPGPLFDFLGRVTKAITENANIIPELEKSAGINYGAIKDQIRDEIDFLQTASEASSGLANFLRQSTAQRVGAASRILGEGSLKTGKGNFSGLDLEGSYRISQAQQEASLTNTDALNKTRAGFLSQLAGSDLASLPNAGADLHRSITTASSPSDFKALVDQFDDKSAKSLNKLVDTLNKTQQETTYQTRLIQESVDLQSLELRATQQNQLLTRGSYSPKGINEYSSLVSAAGAPYSPLQGNLQKINANLQQSEYLDSLGLPKGPQTSAYQTYLRKQSTQGQLAALAARKLGRPVAPTTLGITQAADDLDNTGTSPNRDLGDRLLKGVQSLNFNPQKAASNVLRGSSDISLANLQGLASSNQISLGEGGIIAGLLQTNQFLSDIDDNIQSIVTGTPGAPVAGGAGVTASLYHKAGPGATASFYHKAGFGLPADGDDDSDGDYPFKPDQQKGPLADFGGGLAQGFSAIKSEVQTFNQLGQETASNLTNAFAGFFGGLIVGANRSKDAFRQFASSVFADESKLFSSNAIKDLFSHIGGSFDPANQVPASSNATGGPIGFASGGQVPVMLTGGEYVIGPQAARALGPQALHSLNRGYAGGGLVQGGSGVRDDVPGSLPQGSFVVRKSAVNRLGAGYLDSLSSGNYARRAAGGGVGSVGLDGIYGALAGALIGAIFDKKNRGQGALIGGLAGGALGLGYGALFGGNGSPVANGAQSPIGTIANNGNGPVGGGGGGAGNSIFGGIGTKLALSGALGGISYLSSPSTKVLDTPGIERNATQVEADDAAYIAGRPAGSFVNSVRGPDGKINVIGYTGSASETYYGNPSGATSYGYADGGFVNGSPSSAPSSAATVAPVITIHNYGNGNAQGTAQAGGGPGPFGSQDFADQLHKAVVQVVNDQLVQAQRTGGSNSTANRYGNP